MSTRITNTRIYGAGETHRGKVRPSNQDVLIVEPGLGLYAVLDGMGGAKAGERAAQVAREAIVGFVRAHGASKRYTRSDLLEFAIDAAASAVYTAGAEQVDYEGMGTTVVACLAIEPDRIVIGHAGDSRAYLLRGGSLRALTRDHTLVQEFIDAGSMTPEQGERSNIKHVLTRNLGAENGVKAEMLEQALTPGDRLLLCSDGLYGGASLEALRSVLESRGRPARVASQLVELALAGEALDNVSAIVIDVERMD